MGPRSPGSGMGPEPGAALLAVYLRTPWKVSSMQAGLPVVFTAVSPGTGQALGTYLSSESYWADDF